MPDDENSVNVADALNAENGDQALAPEGKKASEKPDRPEISRIMEENRKLKEQYSEQQKRIENLQLSIDDLKQVKDKSPYQEDLLQKKEDKLRALMNNPEAQDWIELQRRLAREEARKDREEAEEKRLESVHKSEQDEASVWLKEKAKELKVDEKSVFDDVISILKDGGWGELSPMARVKKAFSLWEKMRPKEERQSEVVAEGSGRTASQTSMKTEMAKAKQSDSFRDLLKNVADKQQKMVEGLSKT